MTVISELCILILELHNLVSLKCLNATLQQATIQGADGMVIVPVDESCICCWLCILLFVMIHKKKKKKAAVIDFALEGSMCLSWSREFIYTYFVLTKFCKEIVLILFWHFSMINLEQPFVMSKLAPSWKDILTHYDAKKPRATYHEDYILSTEWPKMLLNY